MAKSKAKKMREKLEREGRMNPEAKRLISVGLTTRRTPTLTEKINKKRYKPDYQNNDDSVYFFCCLII